MPRTDTTHKITPIGVCTPKRLPPHLWLEAAQQALKHEPRNGAPVRHLVRMMPNGVVTPLHIAAMIDRKWPSTGVELTVSFMDSPGAALSARIISHMNAWNKTANVRFRQTASGGQVRIARDNSKETGGFWSYLGTEIEQVDKGEQTMNLEGFTMDTQESEFHRVVRHETGHTLGFPHEHMRKELVDRIDREKAIKSFMKSQGWSREEVIAQVLTPIEDKALIETAHADPYSIMCYQIDGSLTKDGKPIIGGTDIDPQDYAFAAKLYPKPGAPATPHTKLLQNAGMESSNEDAAIIDILQDLTRITLKRPSGIGAGTPLQAPLVALADVAKATSSIENTVYSCLGNPGVPTSTKLSAVTGNLDGLGGCLNVSVPLEDVYQPGNIQGDWTIQFLIRETERRS